MSGEHEGTLDTLPHDGVEPADPREPRHGTVVEHFVILERLGAGGMGVVFSAYDTRLDRKVAIKLLRADASEPAQSRLLREAQAMAKLAHENVVAVYEVGTLADRVFIAMELVPGVNLGAWLHGAHRSWRAVLEVFIQAGRGLAAAHRAGIVHRDFKPSNVLLGDDGRARVTDFGLAKLASGSHLRSEPPGAVGGAAPSLTQTGTALGTPRYMAPEQHAGDEVDARADQYSFAVALHEALAGAHPFLDDGSPPPRRYPSWIAAALAPAFADDPARRHPSMDRLLERLTRGPRARRIALAAGATVAVLAGAGLAIAHRPVSAPPCRGAEARLAGVWDPGVKPAVYRAFLATGRPYAELIGQHVTAALDAYAADWVTMRTEACEATTVRGEQSPALLDLRMECLDRRLEGLAALTALFARAPDPSVLDRAVPAALGLGRIAGCADAAALLAAYPPPDDAATRARVAELRARFERAQALAAGGHGKEGLEVARAAVADARDLAYPPVRAELLVLLGGLQKESEPVPAEATLREGLLAAAAARDDARVGQSLIDLIWLLGYHLHRPEEARALRTPAEAALVRAGDPAPLRGVLLANLGAVEDAAGNIPEARRFHEEAVALRERVLGPDHPDVARSLNSLGNVLARSGHFDEARAAMERARDIWSRSLAPGHPVVAAILANLGELAEQQGRHEEALKDEQQALAIIEANYGPDHPAVAATLMNLGNALASLGRLDDAARAQERALAIRTKVFGAESAEAAGAMNVLGGTYLSLGRFDEAQALFERSIATREKVLGAEHPDVAWPLVGLGELRLERRDYASALEPLRRAAAIRTKAFGADGVRTAETNVLIARCLLGLGQPGPAAELAGPAAARLAKDGDSPTETAAARFALARALWDLGRDRDRARSLARDAGGVFAAAGPANATSAAEVERWLTERSGHTRR